MLEFSPVNRSRTYLAELLTPASWICDPKLSDVAIHKPTRRVPFGVWVVRWLFGSEVVTLLTACEEDTGYALTSHGRYPLPTKAGPFWLRAPIYEAIHRYRLDVPRANVDGYFWVIPAGPMQFTACPAQLVSNTSQTRLAWSPDAQDSEFVHPKELYVRPGMYDLEGTRWS